MTKLRALRMAFGLTQYEMADLLECAQTSISWAERNLGCGPIAKKEEEFLYSCVNVLSSSEQTEIKTIANKLVRWDAVKDKNRNHILNYDEKKVNSRKFQGL